MEGRWEESGVVNAGRNRRNKMKEDLFEDQGHGYCKLKEGHIKNITTKKWRELERLAPMKLLMDTDVIFDILDRLEKLEKKAKIK